MKNDGGDESPIDHHGRKGSFQVDSTASELDHGFSPEEQRKIMWRLDRRLAPVLGAMYCVSLMDRANLGSAMVAGLGTELMLIGNRYVSSLSAPSYSPADGRGRCRQNGSR